jgi:hypothetical protein
VSRPWPGGSLLLRKLGWLVQDLHLNALRLGLLREEAEVVGDVKVDIFSNKIWAKKWIVADALIYLRRAARLAFPYPHE